MTIHDWFLIGAVKKPFKNFQKWGNCGEPWSPKSRKGTIKRAKRKNKETEPVSTSYVMLFCV